MFSDLPLQSIIKALIASVHELYFLPFTYDDDMLLTGFLLIKDFEGKCMC